MRLICRRNAGWLLLLVLTLTAACKGETTVQPPIPTLTPFPPDIYVGLSDSADSLAEIVATEFETMTGDRTPIFLSGNDGALLDDVENGELEAALVYYLPADSQLWFSPVALDGVAVIAHPDIGLDNLNSGQIQDVMSGAIKNWSEIGGPDLAIDLLARETGSATREILQNRILKSSRLSGLARIIPTDQLMKQEVLANEGAIGFTMLGSLEDGSVKVDSSAATISTVSNQSYPLTSPIYFVSLVEPEGPLRHFLAWVQSSEGQIALSEKYGMVR